MLRPCRPRYRSRTTGLGGCSSRPAKGTSTVLVFSAPSVPICSVAACNDCWAASRTSKGIADDLFVGGDRGEGPLHRLVSARSNKGGAVFGDLCLKILDAALRRGECGDGVPGGLLRRWPFWCSRPCECRSHTSRRSPPPRDWSRLLRPRGRARSRASCNGKRSGPEISSPGARGLHKPTDLLGKGPGLVDWHGIGEVEGLELGRRGQSVGPSRLGEFTVFADETQCDTHEDASQPASAFAGFSLSAPGLLQRLLGFLFRGGGLGEIGARWWCRASGSARWRQGRGRPGGGHGLQLGAARPWASSRALTAASQRPRGYVVRGGARTGQRRRAWRELRRDRWRAE